MKNNICLKVIALVVCLSCLLFAVACNSPVELLDGANNSTVNSEGDTAANQDENNLEQNQTGESSQTNKNNQTNDGGQADDSSQTNENGQTDESNMNSSPIQAPVPPIQMNSVDEILSVLKTSDTQNYREDCQAAYSDLFATVSSSGFIYSIETTKITTSKDAITFLVKDGENLFYLMPYAKYEDAGIISYVMFRGALYQVCVYNVDAEVLAQTKTISEYVRVRLGRNVLDEVISGKNTVCFMADGSSTAKPKNRAASFIDDNHYFFISTDASQDELKAFLDFVNFEKIFIE